MEFMDECITECHGFKEMMTERVKERVWQWIHQKTICLSLSVSLWVCSWLSDSDNWLSQLLLM